MLYPAELWAQSATPEVSCDAGFVEVRQVATGGGDFQKSGSTHAQNRHYARIYDEC